MQVYVKLRSNEVYFVWIVVVAASIKLPRLLRLRKSSGAPAVKRLFKNAGLCKSFNPILFVSA